MLIVNIRRMRWIRVRAIVGSESREIVGTLNGWIVGKLVCYQYAPACTAIALCTDPVAGKQTQESIPMSGTRGLLSSAELKMHCLVHGRGGGGGGALTIN